MDLVQKFLHFIGKVDSNLLAILVTSLIALATWLVKALFEKPMTNSRETFIRFMQKRIEVLSDMKVRLKILEVIPSPLANNYKEEIQKILLQAGQAAYLDQLMLDKIFKVAIAFDTDVRRVQELIRDIDEDL